MPKDRVPYSAIVDRPPLKLELEWLSGYVSREAARPGVPAPFHDMAYAC